MAELCSKCFHRSVCTASKDSRLSGFIDSNGCSQLLDESLVVVLPIPVKPGVNITVHRDSHKFDHYVDKVTIYRNGSIDFVSKSHDSQGTSTFDPSDLGSEFTINEESQ